VKVTGGEFGLVGHAGPRLLADIADGSALRTRSRQRWRRPTGGAAWRALEAVNDDALARLKAARAQARARGVGS
jgi:hypothetical protein